MRMSKRFMPLMNIKLALHELAGLATGATVAITIAEISGLL